MDRLRKERTPLRAKLSRVSTQVTTLLQEEHPDHDELRVKLSALDPLWMALQESDKKVIDKMLDDNADDGAIEVEYLDIEKYEELYLRTKQKVNALLEKSEASHHSEYEDAASSVTERREKKKPFKLPKIQLMKFNGELKCWLSWWSQFRKIDEDEDMDETDKFQYLLNAMEEGSESREIVAGYPQCKENYAKAVDALKERYGRDDLQLQYYVRELLTLVITNVSKKEKLPLSSLYLKLESHLRCLSTLKLDQADPATWLFPLVESSLSMETLRAWQRSAPSKLNGPKMNPPKTRLELLMEFIKGEVRTEQQIVMAQNSFQSATIEEPKEKGKGKAAAVRKNEEIATAAGLISAEISCAFCDGRHEADRCLKARTMTNEDKTEKLRKRNLCFYCLQRYHGKKKCSIIVKCFLCNGNHHSLMCRGDKTKTKNDHPQQETKFLSENVPPSFNSQDNVMKLSSTTSLCSSDVLLNILQVNVVGENGTSTVRMVGDTGSQRSYIRQRVVRNLGLNQVGHEYIQNVLFGGATTQPTYSGKFAVTISSLNGQNRGELELLERPQICGGLPKVPHGPWINELHQYGIQLTDVGPGSGEIDILIGSDYWGKLLTGKMIKLNCGLVALETSFGWTISGRVPANQVSSNMAVSVTSSLISSNLDVSQLWSLEALGISDPIQVISKEEDEAQAVQHFNENVKRDDDGRYIVALPWKCSTSSLPTNKMVAEKRLQRATHQLKIKEKFAAYDAVFRGWEQEGLTITIEEDSEYGHYLPHRPVFKESATTPVRPVFDASCKTGKNPSLNDCLYKGPNLLELIPSLLLKFRENAVGVSADIRKAFQMINVREEDQKFQKFLWWTDESCTETKVFQHRRVVFGMNCSPFLLAATINYHLNISQKIIPTPSFYVDNLVTSVPAVTDYTNLMKNATIVMKGAGMELRQWARTLAPDDSNLNECNNVVSTEDEEMEEKMQILGLTWDKKSDTLACVIPKCDPDIKYTKKLVLSLVARLFDPIGFLSPALVPLKSIIQESWAAEYGWDEILPECYQKRISKWIKTITELNQIKLARFCQLPNASEREIHVFVDASSTAYAAVIYLRSSFNGAVEVHLLLAKSRLAPTKRKAKAEDHSSSRPTIPRLELMSCVIGARLANTVRDALDCKNIPFTFWSDSTTALSWIRRHDHWGVFVWNRVAEINKTTIPTQWRHVPGQLNPADLPSRGCEPYQLLQSKWWEGPKWLKESKDYWPHSEEEVNEEAVSAELRKSSVLISIPVKLLRFSSYRRNVAVYGWILRFINNCKRKAKSKYSNSNSKNGHQRLSLTELRMAEGFLLKNVQKESFPNSQDVINNLQVYADENGILRVKTRLLNREDKEDFISPILLPKNHPITTALIEDFHRYNGHGGINFIREKLREKYWIVNSRRVVKKVIGNCVICRRYTAQRMEVESAPLPKKRITDCDPFTTTGVDLAGPLYLKKQKAWIVIYTCAVYRCIYLDLVVSLSTEAFVESLERFIATYGRPNTLFSDNGTNFVGAANLFHKVEWKKLEELCNLKQIQWTFNPPTAAWWGGWWERLIRSVKDLLKRMLGKSKLSYDQMRTCLAGVASTINDRPLTVITESNGDLHPLSPSMFIRPLRIGHFPDVEQADGLPERYKKMKEIQRHLQERFRKEYLSLLTMPPNKSKRIIPAIGDVVLVGAENKRRFEWPLGIIIDLYPGGDGKIRVAKVKTSTGTFDRPLQRLYPLEVSRSTDIEGESLPAVDATMGEKVQPRTIMTRRGRVIKKPTRYGQWLYLIK